MARCRDCSYRSPRYIKGTFPDGELDPNYVVCSWLSKHCQELPISVPYVRNHLGDLQNAHTDHNCPTYKEK